MRCRYIRKIFQNEENGYTIAVFSTQDTSVPLSARDKFWSAKKVIAFTAIGYDLPLSDEIEVEMEGNWESSTHGLQYKVESFLEVVPRTREGILGYLSCGSVKGVGPKMAERIVDQFGLNTLEIMEKTPEKLLKVRGISKKKLDGIMESFGKNQVFRELMTFLAPFHVTPKKVNMILKQYQDRSMEIIRKQPYALFHVKGFGFLTVDAIARQCGASPNDPMRISGCISYVLNEEMRQNGHLYLKQDALIKSVLNLLNEDQTLDQITESEINGVLYRLAVQHSIVVDDDRIYRVTQYEEERRTAMMIAKRLMKQIPAESIEKELEEAQKVLGITLSDCQKEAVRMVFRSPRIMDEGIAQEKYNKALAADSQELEDIITDKKKQLADVQVALNKAFAVFENANEKLAQAEKELSGIKKLRDDMIKQGDGDHYLKEEIIRLRYENQNLKEENKWLKEKLDKACEFMKKFVIKGKSMLDKFLEWIGEKVRDGRGR